MPRSREYATNAERQAAYRKRCLQVGQPVSKKPSFPLSEASKANRRKWKAIVGQVNNSLQCVASEMETYYERHSERWQDSDKGEEFTELLESIQTALSNLEDISW